MPNTVKSFEYIKCCSSSDPRPVNSPINCSRYNCDYKVITTAVITIVDTNGDTNRLSITMDTTVIR